MNDGQFRGLAFSSQAFSTPPERSTSSRAGSPTTAVAMPPMPENGRPGSIHLKDATRCRHVQVIPAQKFRDVPEELEQFFAYNRDVGIPEIIQSDDAS